MPGGTVIISPLQKVADDMGSADKFPPFQELPGQVISSERERSRATLFQWIHTKWCQLLTSIAIANNWSQKRGPCQRSGCVEGRLHPLRRLRLSLGLQYGNSTMPRWRRSKFASVWGGTDLSSHNWCNVWVYCVMFPVFPSYFPNIPKYMFGF